MKALATGLIFATLIGWAAAAAGCTNIFVTGDDGPLVGSNLDCGNYFPRIWFVPATGDQFGRYCYGTDKDARIAEGGVNDRGLFIGVNALNKATGWRADPQLADWEQWEGWYETGVPDGILARCATVGEAVTVFRRHNLFTLDKVKFLVADRRGASAVIEWGDGALQVIERSQEPFQISTNVVQRGLASDEIPCYRYRLAHRLLAEGTITPDPDGLRRLLSATHLEFQTPTVVSTICDLKTGRLWVYYFHDFDQPIVLDLAEELKTERHGSLVADLAPYQSYVARVYEKSTKGEAAD